MINATSTKPTILRLAERIHQDIRERGLGPGEPYLKLPETARMLGVSNASANRALQLLEQRGVLVRKQRRGAFVADVRKPPSAAVIDRVHIVAHKEFLKEGFLMDGQILGIQSQLPDAEIVFNFLPAFDDADFVEGLVHEALGGAGVHAFVLMSASLMAQRILAASGLPTVVGGSLYPSVSGLSWIDCDHRQLGRLAAEHLLTRGCRQALLLLRDHSLPGDEIFKEALRCEFDAAGLRLGDVVALNLPSDPLAVQCAAGDALRSMTQPVGIVARSELLAQGAAAAIAELDAAQAKCCELVISNVHRVQPDAPPGYPYFRMLCDPQERGKQYGDLLRRFVEKAAPVGISIPVELAGLERPATEHEA